MDQTPRGEDASLVVREIRSLAAPEARALARIGRQVNLAHEIAAGETEAALQGLIRSGGRVWIVERGQSPAGYASIMPVPGLPDLYDLDGFIAPAHRRQGLGSRALASLIDLLANTPVRQLSYPAPGLKSPAARFLLKNGFFVEHEEQRLVLDDLPALPSVHLEPGFSLRTYARRPAIAHFCQLYEAAFAGLVWRQPYEDDDEVDRDLADPDDLLFITAGRQPIGFLWLRWLDSSSAEIEPVGLLPAYQGRGLGRQLLLAGLQRAAEQGAGRVWVGAWMTNSTALALYEQLGFRPLESTFYLAYDL